MTSDGTPDGTPDWWTTRDDDWLASDARALFAAHFGVSAGCDGVWAAPGRVNLIGEHVDYAGGMSLPFALPQNTAAAVGRRTDGLLRLVSVPPGADAAEYAEINLDDVGPGQPDGWVGYAAGAVWAGLQDGVIPHCDGLDIALVSDVPVGAGLSSSAALECSVALAAYELATGRMPGASDLPQLVAACMRAENEVVGASTGGLDQRSAFYGTAGMALAVDFLDDSVEPVPCDLSAVGLSLLIINTNAQHRLVDGQYASRRGVIDAVSGYLGVRTLGETLAGAPDTAALEDAVTSWSTSRQARDLLGGSEETGQVTQDEVTRTALRRVRHVVDEIRRTKDGAVPALRDGRAFPAYGTTTSLGELMNASHTSLRDLYEVTVPELDCAQESALACGARGARMTGGGFGGSVIALVGNDDVAQVATGVTEEAARRGFPAPTFFTAEPSAGARRIG
ncbi:galactokinase [Corynebacterium sp.]|uniref:galactokinase n=1 Tax=Corynebacterium sp. TaxID=1720 RepID=UPI003B3B736F